jgi:hypothetical protein
MAHERLKDSTLPHSLSEVVADLADLFQKELRLAKAEISSKISTKINAGIWTSAAAVLAFMAKIAKPTGSKQVKGPAESGEICSVEVEEK